MNMRSSFSRVLRLMLSGVIIGFGAYVLTSYILRYAVYPADSDEALHLLEGLTPMLDARAGHWGRLLQNLYFQPWYPPMHSAMLAAAFTIWTPNLVVARLTSVVLWVLALPLMALVVRSLSGRQEATGEVATVLLGVTAPAPFLLATLCMVESLEIVLALIFLLSYIRTLRQATPGKGETSLCAGVMLAVVFLGRIPMASFLAVAVLFNEIFAWWYRQTDWPLVGRLAALLGPIALVALLWLKHPVKVAGFLDYLRASAPRLPLLSRANLTHYVTVLADAYVAVRPWACWIFLSIGISFWQWRDGSVRIILLLLIVTLVALILKRQTSSRFAISAGLASLLLTGYQVTRLAHGLRDGQRWHRIAVAVLAAVTVLVSVRPLHRRLATLPFAVRVNYETDPEINELYNWVADRIPLEERRVVLINGWDQVSGAGLEWALSTGERTLPRSSQGVLVEQFDLLEPSDEVLNRFVRLLGQQDIRYILHLEGGPVAYAGAWWAYRGTVEERITEVSQESFTVRLWDARVMDRLIGNRLTPTEVQTVQRDMRYPITVHATLFAVSSKEWSAPDGFRHVHLPRHGVIR